MNLFWAFGVPASLAVVVLITVLWAKNLRFFSRSARHLDEIDIPNEVKEVRINEVEMLAGDEADFYFKFGLNGLNLTRWQRRRATSNRLREARKWLRLIVSNAVLFKEVARFHIERTASAGANCPEKEDGLAFRVMDRASTVQVIAAACLAKLSVIEVYRKVWPLYIPELADHFQLRGHDLVAGYRHLAKEMLELAKEHYDDITYTRFIFQLTGLFNVEEAAGLNRL